MDSIAQGGMLVAQWLADNWWRMDRAALESFIVAPRVAQ